METLEATQPRRKLGISQPYTVTPGATQTRKCIASSPCFAEATWT